MTLASVPRIEPRLVPLTRREIDVLRELLEDGAENKIIGKRLYLTEDTIKTHMRKIMRKARAANRTELVVSILRREIFVLDLSRRVVEF